MHPKRLPLIPAAAGAPPKREPCADLVPWRRAGLAAIFIPAEQSGGPQPRALNQAQVQANLLYAETLLEAAERARGQGWLTEETLAQVRAELGAA